jgi:tetratricopeptide (TPR) repeat protein
MGPLCAAIADGSMAHQLTNVLADLALFDKAAALLAKETTQDRHSAAMLAAQGAYETQGGNGESGLALMLESAGMDRNDAMVLNNAAWSLITCCDRSQRDIPMATKLAERAARLEPRSSCILDTLAWALHLGGKRREALSVIDDAVRWIDPTDLRGNGVVIAHRARILAALGRRDEALQAMEQAVTSWPRDPELAAELVRGYCDMGILEAALREANRMIELLYPDTQVLRNDPDLEPLRTHLREPFARLLERADDLRREMLGLLQPAIDARLAAPARKHPLMLMEIMRE